MENPRIDLESLKKAGLIVDYSVSADGKHVYVQPVVPAKHITVNFGIAQMSGCTTHCGKCKPGECQQEGQPILIAGPAEQENSGN